MRRLSSIGSRNSEGGIETAEPVGASGMPERGANYGETRSVGDSLESEDSEEVEKASDERMKQLVD
eukprot:CAMPEP_0183725038 /NCGR_PEP_ID=MMETSP0737-20130205/19506_1 /TAXON_ID=385413 /ORGANISM="Thalassiosira miniscula, Strain CCMP1093" /LENGTH=65 /DNA_ID=CAMNT_0025955849 /DNA_START=53 /DNA_END=250 /DNA_ORIENTATION=-